MASTDSKSYTAISLWEKSVLNLFSGLRLSKKLNANCWFQAESVIENESNIGQLQSLNDLVVTSKKSCSVCQVSFEFRNDQVMHFKSDWHCENLRRKEQGHQILSRSDELTSSSAEEQDEEEGEEDDDDGKEDENPTTLDTHNNRLAKLFFENKSGELFSFYKVIVLKKKEIFLNEDELLQRVNHLLENGTWGIFLLGGGHFAAGIFKEGQIVVHKTFHRYVTRAKQGTTQSVHDHHNTHAKSAGANLRRQNELSLANDVTALVQTWSHMLKDCSHIFYRAPGRNKHVFFGGKTPLFQKDDSRLRNIPFPTKRATFKEVKRIYNTLSTIDYYGNSTTWTVGSTSPLQILASLKVLCQKQPDMVNLTSDVHPLDLDSLPEKLRQQPQRKNDATCTSANTELKSNENESFSKDQGKITKRTGKRRTKKSRQKTPHQSRSPSCHSDDENIILEFQNQILDTSYLDEYEISIEDTESTNVSDVNKEEIKLRNALYTACKLNDIVTVKRLLQPLSIKNKTTSSCDNSRMTSDCLLVVMNSAFGKHETTLLHITSEQGYNELTWILLENGADPAVHNKNGLTPYLCAANKTIRKTFARFMTSFPEKYNYVSAQIPSPLSPEDEEARLAKQRYNRKQKKQKQKALKLEQEEKTKFLKLTENEKILLMGQGISVLRCVFCGELLGNRVPFEYERYKCCTIKCLQQHRQASKS